MARSCPAQPLASPSNRRKGLGGTSHPARGRWGVAGTIALVPHPLSIARHPEGWGGSRALSTLYICK